MGEEWSDRGVGEVMAVDFSGRGDGPVRLKFLGIRDRWIDLKVAKRNVISGCSLLLFWRETIPLSLTWIFCFSFLILGIETASFYVQLIFNKCYVIFLTTELPEYEVWDTLVNFCDSLVWTFNCNLSSSEVNSLGIKL